MELQVKDVTFLGENFLSPKHGTRPILKWQEKDNRFSGENFLSPKQGTQPILKSQVAFSGENFWVKDVMFLG